MKPPSRSMPKFMRRRHWWTWAALGVLALVPVYFLLAHPIWTCIVVGTLIAVAIVEDHSRRRRLEHLAELRAGESICKFARSFERNSVDTWVVRAVYEELQDYLGKNPVVPIRATDRLNDDLRIDMEDLEIDLALQISQRTGRSLTDSVANPYYGKIRTVGDVVSFFNAQPKT